MINLPIEVAWAMIGMPSWTDVSARSMYLLCALETKIDRQQRRNWKGLKRKT